MSSWSGSSAPAGRQTAGRHQRTSAMARPAVLRAVLSRPQPLTASALEGTSAARQTRRAGPRPGPSGSRPAGSVTLRRLRLGLSMTRRWPRTGSACRLATRCRNAGSPRCSDAHPAAGREPESPMHDRNRRPQTRRAFRSRLARKQGPPAVCADAMVTVPGRSGIGRGGQPDARFWVNLDAMKGKGLVWLGIPAGLGGPPSGSSARPWVLRWSSMLGTPWNWRPGTATGSSYPAPAAAASSSTAATAPGSSRCSRWTAWIRRAPGWPAAALSSRSLRSCSSWSRLAARRSVHDATHTAAAAAANVPAAVAMAAQSEIVTNRSLWVLPGERGEVG
jgi:hypothetical protein